MAVGEGSLGAGEALCALSQSNANLYDSEFSTQQSNDLPDEVRNFRTANRCESPNVAAETSRSSTPTYEVRFYMIVELFPFSFSLKMLFSSNCLQVHHLSH
ncbi:unnamed protein product [Anisakis simplex]|uniref:Uncharacterized protein n=1 Tax=Anisakis simplex TaxID=6269 RepID=A0A0M3JIF0_ANISI|nr:unnamed protein product [Anisakis simplex]